MGQALGFLNLFRPVGMHHNLELCWFNQSFFEDLPPTIRALRGFYQYVIRHARIGAGNAVENVIEWNLGAFLIAVLARLKELLRLAESSRLNEFDNLLVR